MIDIQKQSNGNLLISADEETREDICDMLDNGKDFWSIMGELFEPYFTNGSYEPFDAGDGNPFVGLSSAPCIAECLNCDDDGNKTIEGNFWYFRNYMLENPLVTLAAKGYVIFDLPL